MADRSVVYRLQADIGQFKAQMAAAGKSVGDAATKMTAADKEGAKFRQGLDSLGGAAGKVGLVAAAGLGAAIAKAANFDQSMSNVRAATGETASNMERLREAALDAGASTAFSATEAAEGIENLAKAGVSTQEIIGGGLSGALDLAAAGQMDVASAAEAAAGAMAQFKLEGEDVPHIADLLAAGAGKAQGDVSDMVMALKQAGTVSAQTGLTLEETTGTLAAMAEQSLLGSDAGTSFKTMLASLTPNSDKAAAAMEQYNIHAFDAKGNFVGMTELAGQLRAGLGGLTDEQRAMTLETIFGSDAVRAASIIYDNGADGIQKWINNTNDAGYASEQAAARLDNLKGDLEELGGALETALIGTGDGSQGMLRGLTQGLTGVINAYNDLPPKAQTATAGILGATAAAGGGIWAFSKLVQGVANTREAMANLGISGTKTAGVLGKVGKAAGVTAGALGGLMILDEIINYSNKAAPGMEQTTRALLDLKGATGVPDDLDSMSESIERLLNPSWGDEADDVFRDKVPFLGDNKEMKEAKLDIDALDASLANLASTAGISDAEAAFADLAKAVGMTPAEMDKLAQEHLPQYREAIAAVQNEAIKTGEANKQAAGGTEELSKAQQRAAAAAQRQAAALKENRAAARETANMFIGLGDSLDDAKVSLGQWIRNMERSAQDLRDFRKNAEQAANKGLRQGLIAALQEAGPEGARRMRQLANATDAEIDRANKAWGAGQREVKLYTNAIGGVPKKVRTEVDAVTEAAQRKMEEVAQTLRNLNGNKAYTEVITTYKVVRTSSDALPDRTRRATGGPVYGPGTATSDSIPAYLSNGEFVIRTAAVERYGVDFFHRLNAMKFASGGHAVRASAPTVAAPTVSVGSPNVRVFIDGNEVRNIVRSEQTADRNFDRWMSRG